MGQLLNNKITGLIGADAISTLQNCTTSIEKIQPLFDACASDFAAIQSLASLKNTSTDNFLEDAVVRAEKEITSTYKFGDQSTLSGLTETAYMLLEEGIGDIQRGTFLKNTKIIEFLIAHPPVNLLEHYGEDSSETLIEVMDPKSILALTRHSESKEWQHHFHKLVETVSSHDFEERDIHVCAVDSASVYSLFKRNKHHIKPWRLSHNKEAGVITLFTITEEEQIPTPHLLQAAVFLHYLFEIRYASQFFVQHTNEDSIGKRIAALIRNDRKSFSFLTDKNVYDETRYWDHAIESLTTKICPESLGVFRATAAVGGIEVQRLVSCNLVDALWNMNISKASSSYFGSPVDYFDYHFKQSLWCNLVRSTSGCAEEQYTRVLISNLEKDDEYLTHQFMQLTNGGA